MEEEEKKVKNYREIESFKMDWEKPKPYVPPNKPYSEWTVEQRCAWREHKKKNNTWKEPKKITGYERVFIGRNKKGQEIFKLVPIYQEK